VALQFAAGDGRAQDAFQFLLCRVADFFNEPLDRRWNRFVAHEAPLNRRRETVPAQSAKLVNTRDALGALSMSRGFSFHCRRFGLFVAQAASAA
jgi:hypothetical protein